MSRPTSLQGFALEVRKIRALLPSGGADASPQRENSSNRVQVLCRFRGQCEAERQRGGKIAWDLDGQKVSSAFGDSQASAPFSFDHVLGPDASQLQVYDSVEPVVREVLHGGTAAILCYGQTSAGKTFTMEGEEGQPGQQGIIPRALATLFDAVRAGGYAHRLFHMSMFEIYNEKLRDLLDPDSSVELRIMEDSNGVTVHGLHEVPITNCEHALGMFRCGQGHRRVAETGMNDRSSRSHCIFMLKAVSEHQTGGKLCLVDLAGSECVDKARCRGEGADAKNAALLDEAKAINQSLSTLGLVIARLAGRKRPGARTSDAHVPYRSSKLTRALQDTIGGNSRTTLIINCSVSSLQVAETLSTLRFGSRARAVVNNVPAVAAGDVMLATLRAARLEIQRLQALGVPCSDEPSLNRTFNRTLPRSLSRSVSPSKRRRPGTLLEVHSEGCSLSPISLTPRSRALSRRVSRSFGAPSHPASEPGSRDRSFSPLALSTMGSRRQSRRISRATQLAADSHDGSPSPVATPLELSLVGSRRQSRRISKHSRVSIAGSDGAISPLSLSPRSAFAHSCRVSRRTSRAGCPATFRMSTGTNANAEDVDVSKTLMEASFALSGFCRERDVASQRRSCVIKYWEFPLTRREKTIRLLDQLEQIAQKADRDAERREDDHEKFMEQCRQLIEERNALQAENELLQAVKGDFPEQAWLLSESPGGKEADSLAVPVVRELEVQGAAVDSSHGEQEPMDVALTWQAEVDRLRQELEEESLRHRDDLEELGRQLTEREVAKVTARLEEERAVQAEELQIDHRHRVELAVANAREELEAERSKHKEDLEQLGQELVRREAARVAEQLEGERLAHTEELRMERERREQFEGQMEVERAKHFAELEELRGACEARSKLLSEHIIVEETEVEFDESAKDARIATLEAERADLDADMKLLQESLAVQIAKEEERKLSEQRLSFVEAQLADMLEGEQAKHAEEIRRVTADLEDQLAFEGKTHMVEMQRVEMQREQWLVESQEMQQVAAAREQGWSDELEGMSAKHADEIQRVRDDLEKQVTIAQEMLTKERAHRDTELNRVKEQRLADEFEVLRTEHAEEIQRVRTDLETQVRNVQEELTKERAQQQGLADELDGIRAKHADEIRSAMKDVEAKVQEGLSKERASNVAELGCGNEQQSKGQHNVAEFFGTDVDEKRQGAFPNSGSFEMEVNSKLAEELSAEREKHALAFKLLKQNGSEDTLRQLSEQSANLEAKHAAVLARFQEQHPAGRDKHKGLGTPFLFFIMVLVFLLGSLLGLTLGARGEKLSLATLPELAHATGENCAVPVGSMEEVAE